MRRNYFTSFFVLSLMIASTIVNAKTTSSDCIEQAFSLLKHESEKNAFLRHTWAHQFIDCESATLGIEVVIHEAVHFEDLGVPAGINEEELVVWFQKPSNIKFNIFLIDGSKGGEINVANLPKPQKMIMSFLKKYYPHILNDDSHTLQSLLEGYITDSQMLSSYSLSKGLTTEFNAYMHGLRTEVNAYSDQNEKPMQRYGVLGFMFFFKAYLYEVQKQYPSIWKKLVSPKNAEKVIALFQQSVDVLEMSEHCSTMDEFERNDLFGLFADQKYMSAVKEILINQSDLLARLSCK
jgi:hypothetical protein